MVWIYLAESAATLLRSESTSKPSLIVKQTNTLSLSCYHACQMDQLKERQSGMTSQASGENTLICPSISSSQDSPAKISALQALEQAWEESEAVFFSRSCAWPKNSSPRSYSLKTSRQSEHEDWTELSKNLPKQGMTAGMVFYPLLMWERRTKESDGFLWLTPTAEETGRCPFKSYRRYLNQQVQIKEGKRGQLNPTWTEWLMGFPSGWTELNDLGIQWFRNKHKRRSKGSSAFKK